jgi:hypothetical protein
MEKNRDNQWQKIDGIKIQFLRIITFKKKSRQRGLYYLPKKRQEALHRKITEIYKIR